MHPFYADLMNILYDKDHFKLALGRIVSTIPSLPPSTPLFSSFRSNLSSPPPSLPPLIS